MLKRGSFAETGNRRGVWSGSGVAKAGRRVPLFIEPLSGRFGMPRQELSPEALALIYLRSQRGWSKKELASLLGLPDARQLYRYERGEAALRREDLESFAARLGYSPEAVDSLLFVHSLISYEPREVAVTDPPTPE